MEAVAGVDPQMREDTNAVTDSVNEVGRVDAVDTFVAVAAAKAYPAAAAAAVAVDTAVIAAAGEALDRPRNTAAAAVVAVAVAAWQRKVAFQNSCWPWSSAYFRFCSTTDRIDQVGHNLEARSCRSFIFADCPKRSPGNSVTIGTRHDQLAFQ